MRTTNLTFGWRVFGFGIAVIAIACLVWQCFDLGQPVPKNFPYRAELALVAALFMLTAGAALEWPLFTAWAAAALALYYGVIIIPVMNGRVILRNLNVYGAYSGAAEQVAVMAGALLIFAMHAKIGHTRRNRLIRIGQIVFGVCAILFGGAHFVYMNLTAPLVPKWLPPNQVFWGYATGVFHIAGGLAILLGFRARLAAVLLTIMYALFTPLALLPQIVADPSHANWWLENALNLALIGVAWTVVDSYRLERSTGLGQLVQ